MLHIQIFGLFPSIHDNMFGVVGGVDGVERHGDTGGVAFHGQLARKLDSACLPEPAAARPMVR